MMLNKSRTQSWVKPSFISEPTRIELKQDFSATMTPMFKATALEVKNDQFAESNYPDQRKYN